MSSDLYLVAHKVRGEAAFDVAIRMCCAECCDDPANEDIGIGCLECDNLGYVWIIPTSGHRAYPWWHMAMPQVDNWNWYLGQQPIDLPDMPLSIPDHYPTRAEPKLNLAQMPGIGKAKPQPTNFKRRI